MYFPALHAAVFTQLTPNSNLLLLRIATGPGFATVAVARGREGGARGDRGAGVRCVGGEGRGMPRRSRSGGREGARFWSRSDSGRDLVMVAIRSLSRLEYGPDQITVAIRLRLRSESGRDAVCCRLAGVHVLMVGSVGALLQGGRDVCVNALSALGEGGNDDARGPPARGGDGESRGYRTVLSMVLSKIVLSIVLSNSTIDSTVGQYHRQYHRTVLSTALSNSTIDDTIE